MAIYHMKVRRAFRQYFILILAVLHFKSLWMNFLRKKYENKIAPLHSIMIHVSLAIYKAFKFHSRKVLSSKNPKLNARWNTRSGPFFIDQHYEIAKVLPFGCLLRSSTGPKRKLFGNPLRKWIEKRANNICWKATHVSDIGHQESCSKFLFNFGKLCYDAHL